MENVQTFINPNKFGLIVMKKLIKKYGNTVIISFNAEDLKINPKIKEGNVFVIVDYEILEK